jgi:hypothetical protein
VNSEIENLHDLLTDGDELLKVRIMNNELKKSKQFIKGTLIKKKRKFSSYIRKFKWDRLQSHT